MAFSVKTWVDRLSEFPNRRKLDSADITDIYDVTRSEGNIMVEGDKLNAATMNDLEQRIADGIASCVTEDDISDLAGAGRTTETVKANADAITALKTDSAYQTATGTATRSFTT